MIHPDLHNALKTINPNLPDNLPMWDTWKAVRPKGEAFVSGSFWRVLGDTLPFAKSGTRQKQIATWIFNRKTLAERSGGKFPPIPLVTKRAILPQPQQ